MYNRQYYEILLKQKKDSLLGKASHFFKEHPKLVSCCKGAAVVGLYLGLTVFVPRAIAKHVQNTSFPDFNTGIVWRSKRALSTQEQLELERLLFRQGIGVGEGLRQMGLLKH